MDELTMTIIAAILGSNALFAFVQFLIARSDNRIGLKDNLDKLEKDGLRTQLLLMILMKPEAEQEILTLGERYFIKLKGNWYMTGVFASWCDERELKPEWFNK